MSGLEGGSSGGDDHTPGGGEVGGGNSGNETGGSGGKGGEVGGPSGGNGGGEMGGAGGGNGGGEMGGAGGGESGGPGGGAEVGGPSGGSELGGSGGGAEIGGPVGSGSNESGSPTPGHTNELATPTGSNNEETIPTLTTSEETTQNTNNEVTTPVTGSKEVGGPKGSNTEIVTAKGTEVKLDAESSKVNEITRQNYQESEKLLNETLQKAYEQDPEKAKEMQEFVSKMRESAQPYYDDSVNTAKHAPALESYSDHNIAHPNEVAAATAQNMSQIKEFEQANNVPENARINDKVVMGSAIFHDTGMAGSKEQQAAVKSNPDTELNGKEIRGNHHAESANRILENADKFDKKDDAVEAAWVAFLHTKSKSGVSEMGDAESMTSALNQVKENYEKANPDAAKIDLSSFGKVNEEGKLTEMNPEVHTRVANEALALRVGDAQRPASDQPVTMTGRVMVCEQTKYTDTSGFNTSMEDEAFQKNVEYIDPNNLNNTIPGSSKVDSVMYTTGERNVDAGTMTFTENGKLEVSYTVKDAYVDQAATRDVLVGRMAEAQSAATTRESLPEGIVTKDHIVHVVQIEKGDESARAALEAALSKSMAERAPENTSTPSVRVELKQ